MVCQVQAVYPRARGVHQGELLRHPRIQQAACGIQSELVLSRL